MQAQMFDNCRVRRSMWDGAFGLSYSLTNTTTAFTVGANPPYAIAVNPGSTAINVTMYTPSPSPNPIMWCHEVINLGNTTGVITLKGTQGTTIGTVPVGKRAEVVFAPMLSPQDWVVFPSA